MRLDPCLNLVCCTGMFCQLVCQLYAVNTDLLCFMHSVLRMCIIIYHFMMRPRVRLSVISQFSLHSYHNHQAPCFPSDKDVSSLFFLSLCLQSDPARVVDMPSVIYVAISLPGFIRCPVDANPPVTMVKWKKDGLPLRIDKVSRGSIHKCVMSSVFHFIRSISVRSSAF